MKFLFKEQFANSQKYRYKRSKGQWVVAIQEYIFTIVATL